MQGFFHVIQVYYGRGKGKTTAAIGAAVRAAGHGLPVLVVQFMKDARASSGEVLALSRLAPPVPVLRADLPHPIARPRGRALRDLRERTQALFAEASREILSGRYRLAVLDELGIAVARGWIPLERALSLLGEAPPDCELVVTGRRMPRPLLERADLVTRMSSVRHPYDRGIRARRGIEF